MSRPGDAVTRPSTSSIGDELVRHRLTFAQHIRVLRSDVELGGSRGGNIGTGEIILLLLLALLLFGAKRLPEIGRSLGSGLREFKDSVTGHVTADTAELPLGD